jgi:hypothetical protein
MKTQLITSAVAGSFLLFGTVNAADEMKKEPGAMVEHPVNAGEANGATLWDFNGNKIGEISGILLASGDTGALAVVETSMLKKNREIVVPWTAIKVQTEKDDADELVYALDADKMKLSGAPKYNGKPKSLRVRGSSGTMKCCTYWQKDSKMMEHDPSEMKDKMEKPQ